MPTVWRLCCSERGRLLARDHLAESLEQLLGTSTVPCRRLRQWPRQPGEAQLVMRTRRCV